MQLKYPLLAIFYDLIYECEELQTGGLGTAFDSEMTFNSLEWDLEILWRKWASEILFENSLKRVIGTLWFIAMEFGQNLFREVVGKEIPYLHI